MGFWGNRPISSAFVGAALSLLFSIFQTEAIARHFICGHIVKSLQNPPASALTEYLYREHETAMGPYHEVLAVEEFDSHDGLRQTKVVRRHVRKGTAPQGLKAAGNQDRDAASGTRGWHLDFAKQVVGLSVEKYEKRRGWSPSFREKLMKMAEKYLNDSIYVGVFDKASGKLLGGQRYIVAPYGKREGKLVAEGYFVEKFYGPVDAFRDDDEMLRMPPEKAYQGLPKPPREIPEADYLGIELPYNTVKHEDTNTGMHIEIGAFVKEEGLDPKTDAEVRAELHLQDMRIFFEEAEDELNYLAKTVHAYADPASRRMYLNLYWAWDLLKKYRLKSGGEVKFETDKEAPEIVKEGTKWVPIVFHPERLTDFHDRQRQVLGEISKLDLAKLRQERRPLLSDEHHVEMVETLDALTQMTTSDNRPLRLFGLFGLVRSASRLALSDAIHKRSETDPEMKWRVPRSVTDPTSHLVGVKDALLRFRDRGTSLEEGAALVEATSIMARSLGNRKPFDREFVHDIFSWGASSPDFATASTAMFHFRLHFNDQKTLDMLKKGRPSLPVQREAENRLLQAGLSRDDLKQSARLVDSFFHREGLESIKHGEIEVALRRNESVHYQLHQIVKKIGGKDPKAFEDLLLHGLLTRLPSSIPLVGKILKQDPRYIEVDPSLPALAPKTEKLLANDLKSPDFERRVQLALNLGALIKTNRVPWLAPHRAFSDYFYPLVSDRNGMVTTAALSELRSLYDRKTMVQFLVGNHSVDEVRKNVLGRLSKQMGAMLPIVQAQLDALFIDDLEKNPQPRYEPAKAANPVVVASSFISSLGPMLPGIARDLLILSVLPKGK